MNVNVKDLAEAAGFHFDEHNEATQRKVELLVEMVARRCAYIAKYPQLEDEQSYYGISFADAIYRHFGIFHEK